MSNLDELREKLGFRKANGSWYYVFDYDGKPQASIHKDTLNEMLLRISDHLEQETLKARIDEINYLDDNYQEDSDWWHRDHKGYSTAMIPMEDYINRRNELQAQLTTNQSKEK